ncbi:hypothetical protein ACFOSC_32605 [Streptantibioticus rubrisoli]|uniref:Uncharacterized protein n=1 Tax=Streptantibioticus rubrisoli TaxID=1387313 RepID=A0ABT1P8Q9_9ACTN|nr:hypothetical protein [Streptantibioticus rubrisoli]MCQ4041740.1 hypothetical protein [Streptantibioticus rubrisoli]
MYWRGRPGWARWVATGYVIGLAEGTAAHAYFLAAGGPHAYDYAPLPVQLFFHALLLLDPVSAVLVARAHPMGPLLGAGVMAVDVAANWWVQWGAVLARPADFLRPVGLLPITLFGLFVLGTAPALRRALIRSCVPA